MGSILWWRDGLLACAMHLAIPGPTLGLRSLVGIQMVSPRHLHGDPFVESTRVGLEDWVELCSVAIKGSSVERF